MPDSKAEQLISVVVPVFNEAANIVPCLRGVYAALAGMPHEILVCYDFDKDSTLPAIAAMSDKPPTVRLVKNDLGRGVAFALQAGFNAAKGDVVVTTMADLSDPPEGIPALAAKIRAGADVVSGSRYMKGGAQHGGPKLKGMLSFLAGWSLFHFAGLGTHDATNNFRAYRREFLQGVKVESKRGFEVALELTTKAHLKGCIVDEVPSTWRDRSAGESRFKLAAWLPHYLHWYFKLMWVPALLGLAYIVAFAVPVWFASAHGQSLPYMDDYENGPYINGDKAVTPAYLWMAHNEHRIPLPRLFFIVVNRLSLGDMKPGMFVNVGVIALAAWVLGRAMLRLRGRFDWTDILIPLSMGGIAQYQTWMWNFQIGFALPTAVFLLALALMVWERGTFSSAGLGRFFLVLMCLPLCGGPGIPLAAVLAVWLGFEGFRRRRSASPDEQTRGLGQILAAVAVFGLLAVYFWGTANLTLMHDRVTLLDRARCMLEFLSVANGTHSPGGAALQYSWTEFYSAIKMYPQHAIFEVMTKLWWIDSVWMLALITAAGIALWLAARRRWNTLDTAVAAGLLAVVALVVALGFGRAKWGAYAGMVPRYATLAAMIFPAVHCALAHSRRTTMAAVLTLLALVFLGFGAVRSYGFAIDEAARQKRIMGLFNADLHRNLPIRAVAERNFDVFIFPDRFEELLETYCRHRLGPWRSVQVTDKLPPHHEVEVDLRYPLSLQQMVQEDGGWRGTGSAPYMVYKLPKPTYVLAARIEANITNADGTPGFGYAYWAWSEKEPMVEGQRSQLLPFIPSGKDESLNLWIYSTIDMLRFAPDGRPCTMKLKRIVLLVPD